MSEKQPAPSPYLSSSTIGATEEVCVTHPLNPRSEVYLRRLGAPTGLDRLAVTLGRLPPGKESFMYHRHSAEEEWMYVLSGRGRAEVGEEVIELGPGDFLGFAPATRGGVAHQLANPYDEDLLYLMGGERHPVELGEFPRAGKALLRAGDRAWFLDTAALEPLSLARFIKPKK